MMFSSRNYFQRRLFLRMSPISFNHNVQFFTATILEWKHLLTDDAYKQIIIDSLFFLKEKGCITVYGFVIMPNHMHILWQIQDNYKRENVQQRLLKFTAQ